MPPRAPADVAASLIWINKPKLVIVWSKMVFIKLGSADMSEIVKSELISRRKALSFMGLAAAFGLAAVSTATTISDAEAQTAGMERRQARRTGRHERRTARRTGRTQRREERRN